MILRCIRAEELPAWRPLGWRVVGGHVSPSVGVCLLVEWHGSGEPLDPVDLLYLDFGGEG